MVNFGSLTAEVGSGVWGTPANFNGFREFGAPLQISTGFASWQRYCTAL